MVVMKLKSIASWLAFLLGVWSITPWTCGADNPWAALEVFGGGEAPRGRFLFTVGLRHEMDGVNKCGGSLIAPQYILTAAHCAMNNYSFVSIGSHQNRGTEQGEQIAIQDSIIHPGFNGSMLTNDIAILRLAHPTTLPIRPVRLSQRRLFESAGSWTTVRGWGAREDGRFSDVLMQVELQVIPRQECNQMLLDVDPENPFVVDDTMLCAGGRPGEDSCSGDSGGPLTITYNREEVQVGVVSWGLLCGAENSPGVYARISIHREFIDRYVPNLSCSQCVQHNPFEICDMAHIRNVTTLLAN